MVTRFSNLSMQKKLMLAFSLPVIALCCILLLVFFPTINRAYEARMDYSMSQTYTQAELFIESYVSNMVYMSELLVNDGQIREILADESFHQDGDMANDYREFHNLTTRLMELELSSSLLQFGIYVPDNKFYTVNERYLYPYSDFQSSGVYKDSYGILEAGGFVFGTGEETEPANREQTYQTLVLYRMIFPAVGDIPLAVVKVSLRLDSLKEVLENANISEGGMCFLLDEDENVIISSEGGQKQEGLNSLQQGGEAVSKVGGAFAGGIHYRLMRQEIGEAGWALLFLVPENELWWQGHIVAVGILLFGLGTMAIVLFVSYFISKYYVGRLVRLREGMQELQNGNINVGVEIIGPPQEGDEITRIYQDFNYMVEQLRKLLQEHYRMGKDVMEAQFKALQAQINPHFLYNTLDLINWMAQDYGSDEIVKISCDLARFYRLSLNHGKTILTIEEELQHVQTYVEIENFHFEQAIHLEIDVPDDIRSLACPNIILQPFVENAILHGIAEFPDIAECTILIRAAMEDGDILFRISDDGHGMSKEQLEDILPDDMQKSSKGYGVKNINFRLRLYYGDDYGVRYESVEGEGTTVFVRIPALSIEETERKVNS